MIDALTENEGVLMALVVRAEPLTAYQISKIYEDSPVSNFNTSKGKIYPMIRRLRDAGYLEATQVSSDRRGTEQLSATDQGREAVRRWLVAIKPAQLLPDDPLRTRVQSLDLLTRDERIEWIAGLKLALREKLDSVERYAVDVSVPFKDLVHDNAVQAIRSRMDWLDRLLAEVVGRSKSEARTTDS
ncbi:PadR family transcriptional regulator [Sphingomonas sp. ASV193]|uniref:PadR family transcriptional regulator n=1 Tax=Sphingomonas sp. ASV193 TaxID=3144405 RepID=UPI0032E8E3D8